MTKTKLHLLLCLIIIAVPLSTGFTSAESTAIKPLVLHIGIWALLIGWAWGFLSDKNRQLIWTPVISGWILWILWLIFTYLYSPYRWSGQEFLLNQISFGTLFFLTLQTIRSEKFARHALSTIFILFGLSAAYGLTLYYGLSPFPWQRALVNRPPATFGNPVHFSGFLILTLSIIATLTMHKRTVVNRVLYGLVCIMGLVALTLTQTRLAWLIAMTQIIILTIYYLRRRIPTLLFALTLTLGSFAALFLYFEKFRQRMLLLLDLENPAYGERLHIWKAAFEMARQNIWIGNGGGMFRILLPEYRDPSYRLDQFANVVHHAHNEYLEIVVNHGVIGLALFLSLLCVAGWGLRRAYRTDDNTFRKKIVFAIFIGMAGFLIINMANVNFQNISTPMIFWIIAALGVGLSYRERDPSKGAGSRITKIRAYVRPIRYMLIPIGILGLAILLWFDGSRYLSRQDVRMGNDAFYLQKKYRAATHYYESALRLDPYDPETLYQLGYAYLKQDDVESALGAYDRLDEILPNFSEINFYRGECYRLLKDTTRAVAAYKIAMQKTQDGKNCYRYGLFLMESDRETEGIEALKKAIPYFLTELTRYSNDRKQITSDLQKAYELLWTYYVGDQKDFDPSFLKFLQETAYLVGDTQTQPHFYLGKAHMLLQDWDEAIHQFEIVSRHQPNNVYVLTTLGRLYTTTGQRPTETMAYLQRAIELQPQVKPFIMPDLISANIALGDSAAVEKQLREFRRSTKEDENTDRLINSYLLELAFAYSLDHQWRIQQVKKKLRPYAAADTLISKKLKGITKSFEEN
ncbi:MAG: hypothetical protein B6244_06745 [Candidatus Cloacimonetes bacterium 4572_55]|nr:MAG: hypothetical protein B6244_06745 [Candidatus Cloacimonetes bacterium 4572_55]